VKVSIVCPGPVESEISAKAHRNPALPKQDEGKKMPTERCTELIMKGLYYDMDEMWISEQPFLVMTYLTAYMPALARTLMVKYFGPARVHALKAGLNLYDPKVSQSINCFLLLFWFVVI
jgi:dehydrogenase/reductase SDR family protein 7